MVNGTVVAEGKQVIGQVLENPDGTYKPGDTPGTHKVLMRGGKETQSLDLSKYRLVTFE